MSLTRDIQGISHRLHPPRLEYLGIGDAAAALCREISSQQGVQVRFQSETVPEDLPKRTSVCLYRVLQESLQNATKHSGAAKIEVYLYGGDDQIELTIRDSGIGFDLEGATGRGLGLTSMQERLKSVNGQLIIDTKPQRGTSVRARVPLPQK
jgi:signal transduction histidine kinase